MYALCAVHLIDVRVQHGNVTEPYYPFGLRAKFVKVELIDDAQGAIASARANDGMNALVIEHCL